MVSGAEGLFGKREQRSVLQTAQKAPQRESAEQLGPVAQHPGVRIGLPRRELQHGFHRGQVERAGDQVHLPHPF